MKAAISPSFDYSLSFADTIPMVREAGFEIVALGGRPQHSGYAAAAGRAAIRKLFDVHGMTVDSVHAPIPEGDRLFSLDEAERAESLRQCRVALDATEELNGRMVVIHLIQPYDVPHGEARDRMIEHGRRSVGALAAHARERGVKLALENGQRRDYDDVLAGLLTEFDDECVGLCYDSGHENVQGTCFRLLEEFGHRLLTVHLHDNTGKDWHMLPGEGNIDWRRFREVFHALPYSGNLLLEVSVGNSQFKDHARFLAEAQRRARVLLKRPSED